MGMTVLESTVGGSAPAVQPTRAAQPRIYSNAFEPGPNAVMDHAGYPINPDVNKIWNPDGSVTTEYTMGGRIGNKEVVYPSVWDGKKLSPEEANMRATEFLNMGGRLPQFDTPEESDAYAIAREAKNQELNAQGFWGKPPQGQPQQQPIRKIGSMTILPADMPIAVQQPAPLPAPEQASSYNWSRVPRSQVQALATSATGQLPVAAGRFLEGVTVPQIQAGAAQNSPVSFIQGSGGPVLSEPTNPNIMQDINSQVPIVPIREPMNRTVEERGRLLAADAEKMKQAHPLLSFMENMASGGTQLVGDLPVIMGTSIPLAPLGPVTAGATGFGASTAIKEYAGGAEPGRVGIETAKSAALGGTLGLMSKIPGLKGVLAEMGTMIGMPALMEGRAPTAEEVGAGIVFPLAFRTPGAIRAFLSSRGVPPEIATVAEQELLQLEYKPQPRYPQLPAPDRNRPIDLGGNGNPPIAPEPVMPRAFDPRYEKSGASAIDVASRAMPIPPVITGQPPARKYNQEKEQPAPFPKELAPVQAAQMPEQAVPSLPSWVSERMTQEGIKTDRVLSEADTGQSHIAKALESDPVLAYIKEHKPELYDRARAGNITANEIRQIMSEMEVPSRDRSEQGREVLGQEREGQELRRSVQVQGESPEAPTASRVLQAPEREIAPTPVAEQPAPVTPQAGPERAAQPSPIPRNTQIFYNALRARLERPGTVAAAKERAQAEIDKIEAEYPDISKPYGKNIATGRTEQQGLLDKINQAYEQTGKLSPQEVDMRVDELVRTGKADAKLKSADQATKRHAVSEPELARIWQEHVESAKGKQGPARASAVDELVNAVMEMPRRIATAIAKLHNVDWKGSTRAIKDRIVKEIRKLLGEEIGAARNPFEKEDKIVAYHGSDVPFDKFDPSKLGKRTDPGFFGIGAYFVDSVENAQRWGKNVVTADIQLDNPLKVSGMSEFQKLSGYTSPKEGPSSPKYKQAYAEAIGKATENLKQQGYDGVEITRSDGVKQYVLFYPDRQANITNNSLRPTSEIKRLFSEETGAARIPGSGKEKEAKSSGRRVLEGIASFSDTLREKKSSGTPADKEARMNKALEETKAIVESGGKKHYTMEEMNNIAFSGVGSKVITDQVLKGRSDKKLLQEAGAVTHLAEVVLGSARQKMLDVIEGRTPWEKGVKQIEEDLNGPVIESMRNLDSDIGRTFRWIQNQVVPRTELELADKMREAILAQKGKLTAAQQKQFKRLLSKDLSLEDKLRLAKEIGDPKLKDYILEYTYNNMLSSPSTLATNFLQTAIWLAAQVPMRVVEGGVSATWDAIRKAGTLGGIENNYMRTKYAGEALRLLAGIPAGVSKGRKLAWDVLKTNAPTAMDTRVEQEIMSSIRAFERLAEKHDSKTLKAMATTLSWASRTMRATDILLKTVAFEGEMKAILHREATNLAKKANVSYSEAMDKVMNRPSAEVQAAMKAAAEKFAHTSTFNDAPNALTRNLISARGNLGIVGHLGVPFMNTMINYMARSNELIPGVGLAKQALGASTGGRGVTVIPANELVARQLVGTAMAATAGMLFSAGLLTGRGSEDSKRRQLQGRTTQPDSLWVGDSQHPGEAEYGRWVSIKVLGPLAAPLLMTTRFMEAVQENKGEDKEKLSNDWIEKTAWDVAEAYRDHMVNSTFIKGAMNMVGYSTQPFTLESTISRTAGGVAGQFVPSGGLVRTMQRTWEASQSDEGLVKAALNGTGVSAKEVNNWYDPLLSMLPGNKVPSQLDVFGRPVKLPGGLPAQWLPVQYMNPSPDPVDKELNRLGQAMDWYPAKPARIVQLKFGRTKIDNYRIPDKLYRDYAFSVGSDFKKWLDKEITLPGYRVASDEGKMEKIQKKLESIRSTKRNLVRELIRKQLVSEGKITANGTLTVEDL